MDAVIACLIGAVLVLVPMLAIGWLIRAVRRARDRSDAETVMRVPAVGVGAALVGTVMGLLVFILGAADYVGAFGEESGVLDMPIFGLGLFVLCFGVAVSGLQWQIRAEPDAISQVTSWGSVRRIRYQDVDELRIDKQGQFRVTGSDGTVIRSTGRSDPGPVLEALIRGAGLVRVLDLEETVFRRPGR